MDIIDQMNAAFQSGQLIFGASSVGELLACALKLRARVAEAITDELRDEIVQLEKALEKAREDDFNHTSSLRQVVEALTIFTDPEHGPITCIDWKQILKAESHAREMLR